jgi:surface antigen
MPGFENASQDNGNWYETKSWGGQCTWFVHAVLPDGAPSTLPGADTWAAAARNCPDKFAVDDQPAAGSVAIWGAVYHHVAFVTKVNDDGSIEVWDANYHDPTDQKVRGPRQLQPQDLQRFRMQYAHPLGGAPAQPAQPAPQPEPIPDSIVLCPGPIHLGDDVVTSRIIWSRTFSLDQPTVEHFSKSYVTFRLEATPKKDPRVCINRTLIGEAVARLGDWQAFRFAVPPGTLRVGGNLIDLETIIADLHNTFDDCEIKDITLTL